MENPSALAADFARYGSSEGRLRLLWKLAHHQGMWASVDYRFGQWVRDRRPVPRSLLVISFLVHKLVEMTTGISIAATARIGPGLLIGHFSGIIIGRDVVMGADCAISQGVTIGEATSGEDRGSPVIGDGVYIAPGAKVFGPITIGARTAIGANAVVNRDLPADAVAVGVPARVVKIRGELVPRDGH